MATGTLDWSQCPAVESVPGKVGGAWVLRGTRMPVAAIFENIEAGATIDNIMEWFDGLDREQVKAVIEFAVRGPAQPRAPGSMAGEIWTTPDFDNLPDDIAEAFGLKELPS
jgi:uncharacterized protein (DUF433 family)